ncbi:MAG: hypothetical protein II817_01310 [Bacteroidales bacterium]|nr:hypothetical protein [Bacteroidales bacterium]
MKRCPKCGSGAEFTNRGESIFADIISFGAGVLGHAIGGPVGGVGFERNTREFLCEYKEYKCTNPKCKYEWIEKNV